MRALLLALGAVVLPMGAGAQQQPSNRGVIELMNQVESVNAELNKLRGELEVLNNSLDNAQRRQRDMYLDLDTRLRRIEGEAEAAQKQAKQLVDLDARLKRLEEAGGSAAAAAVPTDTAGSAAAVEAPVPPAAPTPPNAPRAAAAASTSESAAVRRAYDNALNAYRAGDYQGAITAFDAFVKRYPRDPLAANAQYWIGDAWFNLRDFRAALAAQQQLVAAYPDSPKVPDAMLNLSSAQIALGESAAARKTLEDLVARYPQTDAAEKARQRLAKLR